MLLSSKPYSASFTTGALLLAETVVLLSLLEQMPPGEVLDRAKKESHHLRINSEVARRKIAGEVLKRYRAVNEEVWSLFRSLHQTPDQLLILFYVCLKTYHLLSDFALRVIINRWQQRLLTLDRTDFERFLDEQTPTHPELKALTEPTRRKLAQITMLMLKQAGLVKHGKLTSPPVSVKVWQFFINQDDEWMLDVGMLTRADRERLGLTELK